MTDSKEVYEITYRKGQHQFGSIVIVAESIDEAIAKAEARGLDVTAAATYDWTDQV